MGKVVERTVKVASFMQTLVGVCPVACLLTGHSGGKGVEYFGDASEAGINKLQRAGSERSVDVGSGRCRCPKGDEVKELQENEQCDSEAHGGKPYEV